MRIEKVFEAFPPPKFLDLPYAGLSIHDSAIRVIQFAKKDGSWRIAKFSEKSLSAGAITSGEVNDKQELVKVLAELKKELDLSFVKVSIPEEKAYLFTAKIPAVALSEVRNEVEKKIAENVPVPPGELIFDYKVVDSSQKDYLRVVVSNLPISVAETYVDIISTAGLTPISLEMESQAIVRSLVEEHDLDTVLIVNFAKEKAGLYVASKRVVNFTSTIQMKGDSESDMELLSHEIKKLYSYWHTLKENTGKEEKRIKEIIICGEDISGTVLPYLSTHHNTKSSIANVWVNSFDINEVVPVIDFESSLKYPATIGLALHSKILM